MKKVLIIGNCGSGKSTLARLIHAETGLELIHLDQHHWQAGWVELAPEVWREQVKQLIRKDQWIMDGNFGGTFDLRFPVADTVIFLDLPVRICLWRVIKRVVRHHGRVRPDMPEGCPERFSWSFLHYVAVFRITRRASILQKLKGLRADQQAVHLKTRRSVKAFVASLGEKKA